MTTLPDVLCYRCHQPRTEYTQIRPGEYKYAPCPCGGTGLIDAREWARGQRAVATEVKPKAKGRKRK